MGLSTDMQDLTRRDAGLRIALTWCAYIAFVLLTHWDDYGLIAQPKANLTWFVTRLSTVSLWLLVAVLLLHYRNRPVSWRSFSASFVAAGIVAIVLTYSFLGSTSRNGWAIAGTIVFYALVSGFLCVTVRKPAIAAGLGMLLFAVQLFLDAVAHIVSGLFRFH